MANLQVATMTSLRLLEIAMAYDDAESSEQLPVAWKDEQEGDAS